MCKKNCKQKVITRLKRKTKRFSLIFKTRHYCSTALLLTLPSLSTPANCPVAILILSGWTARLRQTEIWLAFAVISLQNWEVFSFLFFLIFIFQQKPMKSLVILDPTFNETAWKFSFSDYFVTYNSAKSCWVNQAFATAAGIQPGVPQEPPPHVLRQINLRFALYWEATVTKYTLSHVELPRYSYLSLL